MIVFKLIVKHQIIISVTETSSKMVSPFLSKSSQSCIVRAIQFCSNSPACGPNTYQVMYGKTLDSQCQFQQW